MDNIYEITKITKSDRDKMAKWYGRLNEAERIDVHKLQTDLMRENRGLKDDISEFAYAMLITAMDKRSKTLSVIHRKGTFTEREAEQLEKMKRDYIYGAGRQEGKIERLIRVRLYFEIKKLREENMSWMNVQKHIAKWHKKKISHTHIKRVYDKITEEHKHREGL